MNKQNIFIFAWVLMFLNFNNTFGQTHELCLDTNVIKTNNIKIGDFSYYYFDFVENLADGNWLYYEPKKCFVKKRDDFLLMKGVFLNNVRHGEFIYYFKHSTSKLCNQKIHIKMNYSEGLISGPFQVFSNCGGLDYEGNYTEGKKNGFFVEYYSKGQGNRIKQIDVYVNDTLVSSVIYDVSGRPKNSLYLNNK